MPSAIVLVCVDPRLNHELLRIQIGQHLSRLGLHADSVYLVNDVGGNLAPNFDHALELLVRQGNPPVFAGILHHDDCLADQAGLRTPLPVTVVELTNHLSAQGITCPVHTGQIQTENNAIVWDQSPEPQYRPYQAFSS